MTVYEVQVYDEENALHGYYTTLEDAKKAKDSIMKEDDEWADEDITIDTLTVRNEEELCALLTELANG